MGEPDSIGRENMVAIISQLQVCGGNKLSTFIVIYRLGDGLTSFNKGSSANFSGEKSTVIVKKSSPKNLSVDCRSTLGRLLTKSRQTTESICQRNRFTIDQ